MHYLKRHLNEEILERLKAFPAVAILGPRQCGKSTLARHLLHKFPGAVYLDLELPSDLRKIQEPELFLEQHDNVLVCFDEIQRVPDLFTVLRSIIDRKSGNGQFLILGSASRDLIRQSSESLAGRISYVELSPLLLPEFSKSGQANLHRYWLRGGFPRSLLAPGDQTSFIWRHDFIKTFVERDVFQIGPGVSPDKVDRLLRMCAHISGQLINYAKLGSSLDMSDNTIRHYLDLLNGAFVVRILRPFYANLKKRLVKSPKIYIRDSGILNALLGIETFDQLMAHPEFGATWEGCCLENIISSLKGTVAVSFYRTAKGEEADLVLETGNRRFLVECKASSAPTASKSLLTAISDLTPEHTWIIAPVETAYPNAKNITITSLWAFLNDKRLKDFRHAAKLVPVALRDRLKTNFKLKKKPLL